MSSILGALALVIVCGSDLVQQVRMLPFDGMPIQYYSIDVYGQILRVDYRNQTAQIVGILPEGAERGGWWYCPSSNTYLCAAYPNGNPWRLMHVALDTGKILDTSLSFDVNSDHAIQPLGHRWLACYEPNGFSALLDCRSGMFYPNMPEQLAKEKTSLSSSGNIAYSGWGFRHLTFSKTDISSDCLITTLMSPDALPQPEGRQFLRVFAIHRQYALIAYGIGGEKIRQYAVFDIERGLCGPVSPSLRSGTWRGTAAGSRDMDNGRIEYTFIDLLSTRTSTCPESPQSAQVERVIVDPETGEVCLGDPLEYDPRREMAVLETTGECVVLPRCRFDYVTEDMILPGRDDKYLTPPINPEERQHRITEQEALLAEAVGETREVFLYDRKLHYAVRHLSISGTAGTQKKSD